MPVMTSLTRATLDNSRRDDKSELQIMMWAGTQATQCGDPWPARAAARGPLAGTVKGRRCEQSPPGSVGRTARVFEPTCVSTDDR